MARLIIDGEMTTVAAGYVEYTPYTYSTLTAPAARVGVTLNLQKVDPSGKWVNVAGYIHPSDTVRFIGGGLLPFNLTVLWIVRAGVGEVVAQIPDHANLFGGTVYNFAPANMPEGRYVALLEAGHETTAYMEFEISSNVKPITQPLPDQGNLGGIIGENIGDALQAIVGGLGKGLVPIALMGIAAVLALGFVAPRLGAGVKSGGEGIRAARG